MNGGQRILEQFKLHVNLHRDGNERRVYGCYTENEECLAADFHGYADVFWYSYGRPFRYEHIVLYAVHDLVVIPFVDVGKEVADVVKRNAHAHEQTPKDKEFTYQTPVLRLERCRNFRRISVCVEMVTDNIEYAVQIFPVQQRVECARNGQSDNDAEMNDFVEYEAVFGERRRFQKAEDEEAHETEYSQTVKQRQMLYSAV